MPPAGRGAAGLLALKNGIADRLVFRKIRARMGGRLRFFISGGAPLSREIAEFLHAIGVLILEGYGLTETSTVTTVNRLERYKFGTVGKALPGTEIRIAADGEILVRGPHIFREYFNDPAATREAIEPDGWFHTGDIGVLDEEGFLRITDRKKDIIVTSGGKNIAPQNLENLLKNDRYISQAFVYGDRKKYLTALLTLAPEEIVAWAARQGIPDRDVEALAKHPEVLKLMRERVDEDQPGAGLLRAGEEVRAAGNGLLPGNRRTDAHAQGPPQSGGREVRADSRRSLRKGLTGTVAHHDLRNERDAGGGAVRAPVAPRPGAPLFDVFDRPQDVPEPSGTECVKFTCPDKMPFFQIDVRRDPADRDAAYFLDVSNSAFGQMEISFIIVNDPDGERFTIDRDENGHETYFGTARRNVPEEIRAMEAGLAPGQVRRGLRMMSEMVARWDAFFGRLGNKFYFLEPLWYNSAILYERAGFQYIKGKEKMEWIDQEFRPGGLLHARLDGSTPFRRPGAWTVRGRSWAIHDGILDEPWESPKMYKTVGVHAGVSTFTGERY